MQVGFNLIEALMVIAIIAMLATLLLPSLSQVRERTRRFVCMNNLHRLQVAIVNAWEFDRQVQFPVLDTAGGKWLWDVNHITMSNLMNYGVSRKLCYCPSNPKQNTDDNWNYAGGYHIIGYWVILPRVNANGNIVGGCPSFGTNYTDCATNYTDRGHIHSAVM